jgi:hypothetical protein
MQFKGGDATDTALCIALKHEFLRCDDAFSDFAAAGTMMITHGENRRIAYKTYNAYARFIHSLYEFFLGAIARERHDTKQLPADMADKYVASETQRALNKRREAILNGTAPSWENDLIYYPEAIPPEFAQAFRRCRNKVSAHVTHERSNLNLSEFYDKYHKFLGILYHEAKNWWGRSGEEFPDLSEITDFTVLIKDMPPR